MNLSRRDALQALAAALASISLPSMALADAVLDGANWPRPLFPPAALGDYTIDLNGRWQFAQDPPGNFWQADVQARMRWSEVTVPGELLTQGHAIALNNEYPYQRLVDIPAHYRGRKLLLRFDGVFSYARVWVNGHFVRDHHGGFTSWDCDITSFAKPGEMARITVGVTDDYDDESYGGFYAKHTIGGILRPVRLLSLPQSHVTRLHTESMFDAEFVHATLKVNLAAQVAQAGVQASFALLDPEGRPVELTAPAIAVKPGAYSAVVPLTVRAPLKWDAEHPNLYLLRVTLQAHGAEIETVERRFGFRSMRIADGKLLVNGREVKLRGVCHNDTHPLAGRVSIPEIEDREVRLYRDANINFSGKSAYPPSEAFLDACDKYGLYVEEESGVCWDFIRRGGKPRRAQDPAFLPRFMNQLAEMIERDRSRPSVIIWSIGNESIPGPNFDAEAAYVLKEDPSRPRIFSDVSNFILGTNGPLKTYEILSRHYPGAGKTPLGNSPQPAFNDEWAHPTCYIMPILQRDPGVRNFWGRNLKRLWEDAFRTAGCLGGSIWAGVDEVFFLADGPAGYGEWGLLDGWRRQKPEYWLAKKAYSPIRIAEAPLPLAPDGSLTVPIENWHDHTDLRALKIGWQVGNEQGAIEGFALAPHTAGQVPLPARTWRSGETVMLSFHTADGRLVDSFALAVGEPLRPQFPAAATVRPKVNESTNRILITGGDFSVEIDKRMGLLANASYRGETVMEDGPYMQFGDASVPSWYPDTVTWSWQGDAAAVRIAGFYMWRTTEVVEPGDGGGTWEWEVVFTLSVDGDGLITTKYELPKMPKNLSEVGVYWNLPKTLAELRWQRQGLWSVYPEDHIGRLRGIAEREPRLPPPAYGQEPQGPWSQDSRDYFLFGKNDAGGRGTNDFRSMKHNIWRAMCTMGSGDSGVCAEAEGDVAARAEIQPDGRVRFYLSNAWSYPGSDYGQGNASELDLPRPYANQLKLRLCAQARDQFQAS